MYPDIVRDFLRWTLVRDALARGWWLVTALHLVVVAELTPTQLILVGVFQGITVVLAEVPAGVLADAVGRRFTLVTAHVVMGAGMTAVAVTDSFVALVVANCLWGLGWALTSGADVAWITDELDRPDLIDRVVAAQAGAGLRGTIVGLVTFGLLGWATTLSTAIGVAGVSMLALGLGVVARWPESGFVAVEPGRRVAATREIFGTGVRLARAERVIGAMLAVTFLVNGAAEGFGRLYELRLLGLGLPTAPDPVVWFACVAIVAAVIGAVVLRSVETYIDGHAAVRITAVGACAVGTAGLLVFATAPSVAIGVAGALLVNGIALPVLRVVATIVVNRRADSDVRATVHSMLSQAENLGEIVLGLLIASAAAGSTTTALTTSALLLAAAGVLAARRLR